MATGSAGNSRLMTSINLGSAGALDAVVLSGVTAVMLCELFGEIMERMARGKTDGSTLQGGQSA